MLSKSLKIGVGFSSLYHEIHYIEVRYIEVWVYYHSTLDSNKIKIYDWTCMKWTKCVSKFSAKSQTKIFFEMVEGFQSTEFSLKIGQDL